MMPSFARKVVLLVLALCCHAALAVMIPPWAAKHSTHHKRSLPNGLALETYHPLTTFETYGDGLDHPLAKRADATLQDSALAFAHSRIGQPSKDAQIHATFDGPAARHAYLRQQVNGLPVANALTNVAFNHANKVVAFGSSFVTAKKTASRVPTVSLEEALRTAESALGGKHSSDTHPIPTLQYLAKSDGSLALTRVFQVSNETAVSWYEAFVDAHTGELLSVTDYVAHATYRALPIQKQILTEGFEDIVDPEDTSASPLGWHNDGKSVSNSTAGNNVLSYKGVQANVIAESSSGLTFSYPQNPDESPVDSDNLAAALVNAFYIVNKVHDIAYKYGFTEAAFNFQKNNFNKGGKGNDHVIVSVQTSPGKDNAYFTTLPDGINGQMHLFLWDFASPDRDGALENDIVVHENTHGITNRLTGGGTASCLQTLEAGGLGEGWSDAMAEWTEQTSSQISDYVIGPYVSNSPAGLRTHPYSTSNSTNQLKYSDVATRHEVHDIGEVWANMLHNVYAELVKTHGFSSSAQTDPSGSEGNVVWLHLFIDSLPLQPCNPTFVNARDAWIQADANRYSGANKCLLWKVFSGRGLGVKAAKYIDDFSVPSGC